jgi:hypothetical protein
MLIDLAVVLPTVLRLLSIPLGLGGFSLEFLRLLRVLRFQRFLNNVRPCVEKKSKKGERGGGRKERK